MAAATDNFEIEQKFNNLRVDYGTDEQLRNPTDCFDYGLPLKEVYKLAVSFYKEKEGKAVQFSYEDKLQLVAFSQQVAHGPLAEAANKIQPLGALDVVGRDRRIAWQKLGNLSDDQARAGFVELLSRKCYLFSAYIEAHRREKKEQERIEKEEDLKKQAQEEEKRKKDEELKIKEEQLEREELIKRQIQQALNEQTYEQFRKYAEHQFPGEPEKQGALVKQLQEQHYIQYMQQLQAAQRGGDVLKEQSKEINNDSIEEIEKEENSEESQEIVSANMWTRSDIDVFKQSVSQAEGDGVVRVGHGETVTVRVPTHHGGSRLFWEFATDHYDIGFGVYFEYGTPITDQVSVHVSESDEDEELDEDEMFGEETINIADLEAGSITVNGILKPLLTEIVPVFRRDCQSEVYAGSHKYPAEGVYLLKFDNSYSLWRSKTLYYRVYYTQ
ncbi:PREDICTED: Golgi resident protein GCP60 isoform X2 [Nicrophorus vespilloides]|uniref:Golgi resident protein GCP60 isoform X2 n=1 Tax=Nicrophorus vespilloides TaxID=110193 RepID=A0ABM1NA99_NICVS|nr:PREDICTED: Golgi resident protein GCP60 isoform X2 [Nicrophorus vespilloides]